MKLLILTPIAERDVHFYLAAAQALKADNQIKIVFFSFYQPGNDLIRSQGFEVIDPYAKRDEPMPESWNAQYVERTFQTPPLRSLIVHEQLTFGLKSEAPLIGKFVLLFFICDLLLKQIEEKYPSFERYVLQELAGFVGPLALFYSGMRRGWIHLFTEPSFFKGRIHVLKDNLNLLIPEMDPSEDSMTLVRNYLLKAIEQKVVVAAVKDAHHYKDMGFSKVFNQSNFQKLLKKLYFKYIKGQRQEFEYISNHVRRYLVMLRNRRKNEKVYATLASLPADAKLFYFPFHVQLDFSLTIRTPAWLDQLALIEKLLLVLPKSAILVAKEHPASIGCLDQERLQNILKNPQFRLLHPQINSHDILERSTAVVTINSKVGAEALSRGMPVLTFGNAFYTNRGLTPHFENWEQVARWFQQALQAKKTVSPVWLRFLENVWQNSFSTELYDLTPSNVQDFSRCIQTVINSK